MTALTERFEMSTISQLKQELTRLVRLNDYKTVNVLLRCNPNTSMFNTRNLNEEILYIMGYICKGSSFFTSYISLRLFSI